MRQLLEILWEAQSSLPFHITYNFKDRKITIQFETIK